MGMNGRLLRPKASGYVASDADARAYITAVSAADGSSLEPAVQQAVNDFVVGCKADGIWSSIKASCILMGAKTLAGALTPLVGTAPTNNNFVSGDYDRTTGLIGNGTTKSIDTLRDNNADPQNSFHLSAYATAFLPGASISGSDYLIGDLFATGGSGVSQSSGNVVTFGRSTLGSINAGGASPPAGFWGMSRASASQFTARSGGSTTTTSSASQAITQRRIRVFASNAGAGGTPGEFGTQRIAFYSIGESLTLALLDARVAALYNAIGAAL